MALARSPSVPSGNPDKSRADKPFVVGIAGENHLGDGSGLELAAVHLEHGLVLVGIERRTEFGFDASDTVLCERVLQSAFAGGNPGQQTLQSFVLIWQTGLNSVQRTRQIVRRLEQILYQLRSGKPYGIVPFALQTPPEILLFRQYPQQPLPEFGRILLDKAGGLGSGFPGRSGLASDGCR